ncbi:MAG: ABC transporter ATP-binding protein, partial [Pseudomonadota bacterium]
MRAMSAKNVISCESRSPDTKVVTGFLRAQELTIPKRVEQVSTTLEPGKITAICGPNGAGKSSLLLGLAGLLTPTAGTVSLGETELSALPVRERAKSIGYLPQAAEIAWDVAVENLVALGRMPHRDRVTEAVERAIAALSLEELR